jgi:hypothetical protein
MVWVYVLILVVVIAALFMVLNGEAPEPAIRTMNPMTLDDPRNKLGGPARRGSGVWTQSGRRVLAVRVGGWTQADCHGRASA